jgi:MFS family permease
MTAPASTASTGPNVGRLDPARARAVLLILAGIALMVTYVETMVVPALVKFDEFFGNPPYSLVAWILSAYLVVGVVATPIFGKLGDIFGKKRMLIVTLSVYSIAVTIAGFTPNIGSWVGLTQAQSIYLLVAVRALQGVGMGMFPLAFAMIGDEFPPRQVASAQGIVSAMFAVGAAVGLVGGAYITQNFGWQLTYHTVIPIAFGMLAATAVTLPESRVLLDRPLDVPGGTLLGAALATLLLGLTEGPVWGWANWVGVTFGAVPFGAPEFFVLSAVAAAAFVAWEMRTPNPIVDFARLKERNIILSNTSGLLAGTAMFLMFVTNTLLVQTPGDGLDQTVLTGGLMLVPAAGTMMIAGPLLGQMTGRYGPRPVMVLGGVSMTIGFLLLSQFDRTILQLILAPIPCMIGMVALFIAMTNLVVLSSRPQETGIQTGMNQTFRNLGTAIGPVLSTAILATFTGVWLTVHPVGTPPGFAARILVPLPTLVAYRLVYLTAAGLGALAAILSLFVRNFRILADGTRVGAPGAVTPSGPATPAAAGPATPAAVPALASEPSGGS